MYINNVVEVIVKSPNKLCVNRKNKFFDWNKSYFLKKFFSKHKSNLEKINIYVSIVINTVTKQRISVINAT